MSSRLPDFDPSDPDHRRRGTVIPSPASGFAEGDPLVDAGSWALARSRWSHEGLMRAHYEALLLSVPLPLIDRRVVGVAFYERAKLAGALLELRAAAADVAQAAAGLGSLLRSAMWADPNTQQDAGVEGARLVAALGRYRTLVPSTAPWGPA